MTHELKVKLTVWLAEEDSMKPNKQKDKKICVLIYTETLVNKEVSIEIMDESNLPVLIMLGNKSTDALLAFLEDRVLPPNRMFLEEQLKPYGISPYDLIGKMELNKGRVYTDEYYIEVERLK